MTCIDKNVAFGVKMAPKQSGPTFLMYWHWNADLFFLCGVMYRPLLGD